MSNHLFRKFIFLFVGMLAMASRCCWAADVWPDPTRPPDVFGGGIPATGEETETAPPVPVLQSILLSATRKMATISGQPVVLGEKFGEARLVKLTPSEAVLRVGDSFQILKLFPDVEKKERQAPQNEDKSGKRRVALKKKAKQ